MKAKIAWFGLMLAVLLFGAKKPVWAARQRVRKPKTTGSAVSAPRGVGVKVRFRPDRQALLLEFSNFDRIQSGSYELVYTANSVQQGAGGSIIIDDSGVKTLLFGTCSGGVCTYHRNITNARLSIISVLKNGQTVLKPFRINW